ncbi:hypothetical protein Cgig2_011009 [Carnegiea gigantea]|uniref:RNA helicase n=1 Tax=Carnegiea gigantea TaxID=171969 RepID=A0A9Q1QI70_9CARY|nr:hypothetical protein Cgig2_011009 [Carnegiea gigantea]
MAAANLSPPHLPVPLSFPPNKNPNLSPLFNSQIRNRKPQSQRFTSISYFRSSIPNPKFAIPKSSSLSSSTIAEAANAEFPTVATLRELCQGHVPDHMLRRMEEMGFVTPTEVQQQGLPVLFAGNDCVLHAQTGSGKTLTYLLLVYSVINSQRSAVQALVVVPTRELGMQVTKVARMLAANPTGLGPESHKACTVMALLDGGMLKRHKTWLKADPPTVVVATMASLCQMLEKHILDLGAMRVLVIDESNVVHVYVNPVAPMPSCLHHRYLICHRNQKYEALTSLLQLDLPYSAILFVNEQGFIKLTKSVFYFLKSEKSKKTGDVSTTTQLIDFLKSSSGEFSNIALLEDDMNFNARAASLLEVRERSSYLLVATDIAARGVDLPETTHIYNFDLPKSAVHYLHRAGRTGRKPFSDDKCVVTSIIAPEEHFVLRRFQNELKFCCEEIVL